MITKQRERWTDAEHQLFLEALREHGRAWRKIEGAPTSISPSHLLIHGTLHLHLSNQHDLYFTEPGARFCSDL